MVGQFGFFHWNLFKAVDFAGFITKNTRQPRAAYKPRSILTLGRTGNSYPHRGTRVAGGGWGGGLMEPFEKIKGCPLKQKSFRNLQHIKT